MSSCAQQKIQKPTHLKKQSQSQNIYVDFVFTFIIFFLDYFWIFLCLYLAADNVERQETRAEREIVREGGA